MQRSNASEHCSRLNSLSLLDPHPVPLGTDLGLDSEEEAELDDFAPMPPAKRARARYIFQRCLKSTQETNLSVRSMEVFVPPSDSED